VGLINSPPASDSDVSIRNNFGASSGAEICSRTRLLDSTMLVAGSMIGSGIFIVSSIIARQVGAPGWLLVVWLVTGLLTLYGSALLW